MRLRHLYCVLLMLAAAACSSVPYKPLPLDAVGGAEEYERRSESAKGLEQFAAANGYSQPWPPQQWGLRELTLAALYFHPDMATARARATVAHAQSQSAGLRPDKGVRLAAEHHGQELPEDDGPWTLGLALEFPLTAQGKTEARVERSAFLADAAEIDVAAAAWRVRGRVRDSLLELEASREALADAEAQIVARQEVVALIERRVQVGMASAPELGTERLALAQLELARDQEATRSASGLGVLAQSLGLPLHVVSAMKLGFGLDPQADPTLDAATVRRLALRNRLDVHRKLLEFGVADAEVKLAVAGQNPDVTLGPGYAWDQGDNVWSLAVGFSIPSAARAQASIREAEALRELAAREFQATQVSVVATAEAAAAQYGFARERLASAQRQAEARKAQEARVLRQFEAGAADRLQRATARLDTLSAQALLRSAHSESRRSLARLEDALQRPLLGDFTTLPDMRAVRLDGSRQ